MKASSRAARRELRTRSTQTRAAARAHRLVATGAPQTARTHLVAAGLDDQTAKRYAGAFSRGTTPTQTSETSIKLKGRTRKVVPLKLYSRHAFTARLSTYRPKDANAAQLFARVALAA